MSEIRYDQLRPGQRVRITQRVRIGLDSWPAVVEGTIRDVKMLVPSLTADRGEDDIVTVPLVRFVKDNGELSTITVDEHTRIELLEPKSD